MRRLAGVQKVVMKTKPIGGVEVYVKSGMFPDIEQLFKNVERAGFQPRKQEVVLTLTGTLTTLNSEHALTVDGLKEPLTFVLREGKTDAERQEFAKLASLAGKVEVEGFWRAHADDKDKASPPVLVVSQVKVAK